MSLNRYKTFTVQPRVALVYEDYENEKDPATGKRKRDPLTGEIIKKLVHKKAKKPDIAKIYYDSDAITESLVKKIVSAKAENLLKHNGINIYFISSATPAKSQKQDSTIYNVVIVNGSRDHAYTDISSVEIDNSEISEGEACSSSLAMTEVKPCYALPGEYFPQLIIDHAKDTQKSPEQIALRVKEQALQETVKKTKIDPRYIGIVKTYLEKPTIDQIKSCKFDDESITNILGENFLVTKRNLTTAAIKFEEIKNTQEKIKKSCKELDKLVTTNHLSTNEINELNAFVETETSALNSKVDAFIEEVDGKIASAPGAQLLVDVSHSALQEYQKHLNKLTLLKQYILYTIYEGVVEFYDALQLELSNDFQSRSKQLDQQSLKAVTEEIAQNKRNQFNKKFGEVVKINDKNELDPIDIQVVYKKYENTTYTELEVFVSNLLSKINSKRLKAITGNSIEYDALVKKLNKLKEDFLEKGFDGEFYDYTQLVSNTRDSEGHKIFGKPEVFAINNNKFTFTKFHKLFERTIKNDAVKILKTLKENTQGQLLVIQDGDDHHDFVKIDKTSDAFQAISNKINDVCKDTKGTLEQVKKQVSNSREKILNYYDELILRRYKEPAKTIRDRVHGQNYLVITNNLFSNNKKNKCQRYISEYKAKGGSDEIDSLQKNIVTISKVITERYTNLNRINTELQTRQKLIIVAEENKKNLITELSVTKKNENRIEEESKHSSLKDLRRSDGEREAGAPSEMPPRSLSYSSFPIQEGQFPAAQELPGTSDKNNRRRKTNRRTYTTSFIGPPSLSPKENDNLRDEERQSYLKKQEEEYVQYKEKFNQEKSEKEHRVKVRKQTLQQEKLEKKRQEEARKQNLENETLVKLDADVKKMEDLEQALKNKDNLLSIYVDACEAMATFAGQKQQNAQTEKELEEVTKKTRTIGTHLNDENLNKLKQVLDDAISKRERDYQLRNESMKIIVDNLHDVIDVSDQNKNKIDEAKDAISLLQDLSVFRKTEQTIRLSAKAIEILEIFSTLKAAAEESIIENENRNININDDVIAKHCKNTRESLAEVDHLGRQAVEIAQSQVMDHRSLDHQLDEISNNIEEKFNRISNAVSNTQDRISDLGKEKRLEKEKERLKVLEEEVERKVKETKKKDEKEKLKKEALRLQEEQLKIDKENEELNKKLREEELARQKVVAELLVKDEQENLSAEEKDLSDAISNLVERIIKFNSEFKYWNHKTSCKPIGGKTIKMEGVGVIVPRGIYNMDNIIQDQFRENQKQDLTHFTIDEKLQLLVALANEAGGRLKKRTNINLRYSLFGVRERSTQDFYNVVASVGTHAKSINEASGIKNIQNKELLSHLLRGVATELNKWSHKHGLEEFKNKQAELERDQNITKHSG